MGKWIAGLIGTLMVGVLMWFLTERFFPEWFPARAPPAADKRVAVLCSAVPERVQPGGTTEVVLKVTRGGEPVEGASVSMKIGGGHFGSGKTSIFGNTYSGGVFRTLWTAPSPSAGGYVFNADVNLDGLRTDDGELSGQYRTTCHIVVG